MNCISINYKTAPLNIRQLFAFSIEEQLEFKNLIAHKYNIDGCVFISTCNRSEIYFCGEKSAIDNIEKAILFYKKDCKNDMLKYVHAYRNEGALKHLFHVTCGIDSMVLGEDEILRQVKDAYQFALEHKMTNKVLNISFQSAISCSKYIKSDTNISTTPISIGTLTANKIMQHLEKYLGKTVLIVGANGKIGSIVSKNLSCKNEINIIGTSRLHSSSEILFTNIDNIYMISYKDRYEYLESADVIVSATTSPHYTFTFKEVRDCIKNTEKRRLFIDLSVPCDMDSEITTIPNVELLDIDYFEEASKNNNEIKIKELDKINLMIADRINDTLKNIYFQEFNQVKDQVIEKIEAQGFEKVIHRIKDSLDSNQLKALLDTLTKMAKEE